MIGRLHAFGAFWYDFVIDDDRLVAAGVILALALTAVVTRHGTMAVRWIVPVTVVILLTLSLIPGAEPATPTLAAGP